MNTMDIKLVLLICAAIAHQTLSKEDPPTSADRRQGDFTPSVNQPSSNADQIATSSNNDFQQTIPENENRKSFKEAKSIDFGPTNSLVSSQADQTFNVGYSVSFTNGKPKPQFSGRPNLEDGEIITGSNKEVVQKPEEQSPADFVLNSFLKSKKMKRKFPGAEKSSEFPKISLEIPKQSNQVFQQTVYGDTQLTKPSFQNFEISSTQSSPQFSNGHHQQIEQDYSKNIAAFGKINEGYKTSDSSNQHYVDSGEGYIKSSESFAQNNHYTKPSESFSQNDHYIKAESYNKHGETYIKPTQSYIKPAESYINSGESYIKSDESHINPGESYNNPAESFINSGESYIKSGEYDAKPAESYIKSGESYIKPEESYINSGEAYAKPGVSYINSGDSYISSGDSYIKSGESYIQSGESYIKSGDPYNTKSSEHHIKTTDYASTTPQSISSWKIVGPNVEISKSQEIGLNYDSTNENTNHQIGFEGQSNSFDHEKALGRSEGFDYSNAIDGGKLLQEASQQISSKVYKEHKPAYNYEQVGSFNQKQKFESNKSLYGSQKKFGGDFGKDFGKTFEGFGKDISKDFGKDYVNNYENFGKDFGKDYTSQYGQDYAKNFGKDGSFDKYFSKDSNKESMKDFGSYGNGKDVGFEQYSGDVHKDSNSFVAQDANYGSSVLSSAPQTFSHGDSIHQTHIKLPIDTSLIREPYLTENMKNVPKSEKVLPIRFDTTLIQTMSKSHGASFQKKPYEIGHPIVKQYKPHYQYVLGASKPHAYSTQNQKLLSYGNSHGYLVKDAGQYETQEPNYESESIGSSSQNIDLSSQIGSSHSGSPQIGSHFGSSHIGSSNIGSSHIGSSHIGSPQIGLSHIGSSQIGSSPIESSHIGSSHIGSLHIGSSPHIPSTHIESSHIGSSHIGSSHIGSPHISSSPHIPSLYQTHQISPQSSHVIQASGSPSLSPSHPNLGSNPGYEPSHNFGQEIQHESGHLSQLYSPSGPYSVYPSSSGHHQLQMDHFRPYGKAQPIDLKQIKPWGKHKGIHFIPDSSSAHTMRYASGSRSNRDFMMQTDLKPPPYTVIRPARVHYM